MKIEDIIKSIRGRIFEIFPNFEFPFKFTPQYMERPSVVIEYIRQLSQKRMCKGVIKKTELYQLTYFAPTDEYYNSDRTGLYDVSEKILEIFSDEILYVGDRAPKITATTGGVSEKEAYIDLTVERTEYTGVAISAKEKEEKMEKMKKITIKNGGEGYEFT